MVKAVASSAADSIALFARESSRGSAPVCVTCGGRNAGKSQLSRRLIEDTLVSLARGPAARGEAGRDVAYLETDCGQTQFSMPGVLGLYIIRHEQLRREAGEVATTRSKSDEDERLVLPSRCHLPTTNARFFGALSPKGDPERYMTHIAELLVCYEAAMEERGGALPLVVNTHGWVRDLGFTLLQQVVAIVRRSVMGRRGGAAYASRRSRRFFVMQMELHAQTRNLPRRRWWADGAYEGDRDDENDDDNIRSVGLCGDETHILIRPVRSEQSESEMNDTYNSAEARLWHYSAFAQACQRGSDRNIREGDAIERRRTSESRGVAVNHLASVPPYCVSAEDVKIVVVHCGDVSREHRLLAINGMLVGLASSISASAQYGHRGHECIGVGLVRGVDVKKNLLYVVSPLTIRDMHRIDTILLGELEMPLDSVHDSSLPYAYVAPHCVAVDWTGAGTVKNRRNNIASS